MKITDKDRFDAMEGMMFEAVCLLKVFRDLKKRRKGIPSDLRKVIDPYMKKRKWDEKPWKGFKIVIGQGL